jgi:tetratricopeptide (TPR) repeat protein
MSDVSSRGDSPLSLSLARRINAVCNRFELAWQAGPQPRLEDFLGDTPEPERSALLRELIALDIDYRRQAGENPTAEEYHARFPALAPPTGASTVQDSPSPADGTADLRPGAAATTQAGRYQLGVEIGQGGMGAVLQAHDPELDRDLAIKVLRQELQDQPDAVQRFLEEARIAGRLQHPGLVPVYDLGRFPDRRPFFTMKLVQGRTLADLLAQRPHPGHDLPRFLKIFEQVCQTLAFAHSKDVIHRDLKPSNIMVGAFGEVQVMDWGLAKVLTREGPQPAEPASAASTGPGEPTPSLTWVGQVLGTPGYMAPEQARGEVDQLDERCDVFGLGAILCVLLTDQPPYRGARAEVLKRAQQADQADALVRLDSCGADAELVRLAKTCLAPQQEDRPRHAGAVAEQVTAYLVGVQERLRLAEVERAAAQAREEEAHARAAAEAQARRAERRARQRTLTLAATILGFVLLGGSGWLWVEHERQTRRDETVQAVNLALGKAEQLRQQADQTPSETPAAAEQALALWQQTLAALEQAKAALAADEADATTRERVAALRAAVETGAGRAATAVAQARREVQLLADLDAARLARSQATAQGRSLNYAASAAAYAQAFTGFGLEVLRLPKAEAVKKIRGLRAELRTAVVLALDDWAFCVGDRKVRERLRQVASGTDDDSWRRDFRKAKDRPQLEALTAEALSGELPASSLFLLAVALRKQGAAERAEMVLRRAVQLYPADFCVHFGLGELLGERGKQVPAAVVEERVGHLRAAVAARPQSAPAHNNLANALYDQADLEGAIAACRQALKLDPKLAPAHNNLGNALYAQGDVRRAIACYHKALELDPKYAHAHNNLGVALKAQGDLAGAITCFKKALDLDPKYAEAHNSLGTALYAQGDYNGAVACYTKAIELNPKLAEAHNHLGVALYDKGDLKGAITCFKRALELDPKYAHAHHNLGLALQAQGDVKGAIVCFTKALELDPKHAKVHNNLGIAVQAQGDVKGGIACYHKALELDPKYAHAHHNLGLALQAQGDVKGAIACYCKALELEPKYTDAYYNLGNALLAQGDVKGAIACFTKAIKLAPKDAKAHYNLGNALYAKGDLAGARASYKRALDLDPKHAPAHGALGQALLGQGAFKEARAATQEALQLLPPGDPLRPFVTQQLQACQRLLDLEGRLPALLAGDDQPADAVEELDLAVLCHRLKKRYRAAVRFYQGAFAAQPKLTLEEQSDHRYGAASAAALAAAGQGTDAGKLDAKQKTRLRQQALAWLRDNLKEYAKHLEGADAKTRQALQQILQHWQKDTDFDSVRGKEALAQLPEAERTAWQQLWADVAALLKKTQE